MRQSIRSVSLEGALWLNHAPLSRAELLGKIVLLDFFTYCCMNCLNLLPDLARLESEFENELVVIGIHSGKYPHEKEDEAVLEAIKRYKIQHCVINDADHRYWDAYAIKAWPTLVLIDPDGYVVRQYRGEGHLEELRRDIRELASKHELCEKRFEAEKGAETALLLRYPQKLLPCEEYLFISHADEVLVCSYEGEILHTIEDISEPQGLAYINETLYIASRSGNSIIVLRDGFSNRSVWLEGLRNPYGLCSDGKLLYVSLAGAHQIKGYDLNSKRECFSLGRENSESLHDGSYEEAVLAQPAGLALLDEELWFVDSESSSLRRAAYGEVNSFLHESDELQHPMDIAAGIYGDGCGGGRIFISDSYNNAVKVYNPESQELVTLLEGLCEPSGIAKRGCSLYICNTNAHEIVLFDLSKMTKRTLILKENM